MDLVYYDVRPNEELETSVADYAAFLAAHGEQPVTCRRAATLQELLAACRRGQHPCRARPTSTRHLIGAPELAAMKEGAVLVNASRGPLVDEAALVAHCRTHPRFRAGLDVYENEPAMAPGLAELDNVVLVPHLGSATTWTREGMATLAAANVVARPPGLAGVAGGRRPRGRRCRSSRAPSRRTPPRASSTPPTSACRASRAGPRTRRNASDRLDRIPIAERIEPPRHRDRLRRLRRGRRVARQGHTVYPFHLGDMDLPTPQNIVDGVRSRPCATARPATAPTPASRRCARRWPPMSSASHGTRPGPAERRHPARRQAGDRQVHPGPHEPRRRGPLPQPRLPDLREPDRVPRRGGAARTATSRAAENFELDFEAMERR